MRTVALLILLASALPAAADLQVHPGIGLVAVTGADPGVELTLQDRHGHEVGRGATDHFGSFVFRDLSQGARYFLSAGGTVMPLTVLRFEDNPDGSFYQRQTL